MLPLLLGAEAILLAFGLLFLWDFIREKEAWP